MKLKEGAVIIIADLLKDSGIELQKALLSDCKDALFIETNVNNSKEVRRLTNKVIRNYKKIDILVNAVGICNFDFLNRFQ